MQLADLVKDTLDWVVKRFGGTSARHHTHPFAWRATSFDGAVRERSRSSTRLVGCRTLSWCGLQLDAQTCGTARRPANGVLTPTHRET